MTYGGGGGSVELGRNCDLISFSSWIESRMDDPEDPSVIRLESVELSLFGLPAKRASILLELQL